MKKILAGILAGTMLLGIGSLSAEAYYGGGCEGGGYGGGGYHYGGHGFGSETNKEMTETEKANFKSYHEKRVESRKQMLQEEVKIGHMSQEEADTRISIMEKHFQRMEKNNFQRPVEFTELDRQEMRADRIKMIEFRQNFIKQKVADGKLSAEEGNRIIERMENSKTKDYRGNRHGNGEYAKGEHHDGGRRNNQY